MSRVSWQRIARASIVAVIPGALYGTAAIVPIDQASALAGSVTPDDAPGFPVTISRSGSYRLSGNLTVGDVDTTAIQITADFVTLDLNGFSITGPALCSGQQTNCPSAGKGIGVNAGTDRPAPARGVRVFNGSIHGMGSFGIFLAGAGSFVEKVTADNNAGGGMSVAGMVSASAATQNGSFGIIAIRARDCTAFQNRGDGIIMDSGGVATGNVSSENGGYGIYVPYGTATGNTLFLNHSFGISAFCPSSISGNTIIATDAGALEMKGAGCVLADNAARP